MNIWTLITRRQFKATHFQTFRVDNTEEYMVNILSWNKTKYRTAFYFKCWGLKSNFASCWRIWPPYIRMPAYAEWVFLLLYLAQCSLRVVLQEGIVPIHHLLRVIRCVFHEKINLENKKRNCFPHNHESFLLSTSDCSSLFSCSLFFLYFPPFPRRFALK